MVIVTQFYSFQRAGNKHHHERSITNTSGLLATEIKLDAEDLREMLKLSPQELYDLVENQWLSRFPPVG